MRPDIALCYPLFDKVFFTEPVGVCALASYLRSCGFEPWIATGFLRGESCTAVAQNVVSQRPRTVGISMNASREVEDGLLLAKEIRALGFEGPILAGGAFAGASAGRLLPDAFDYLVFGDGEEPLAELLKHLVVGRPGDDVPGVASTASPDSERRAALKTLDTYPLMDRSVLAEMIACNGGSNAGIQASVMTGRGCYGGCKFCSVFEATKEMTGPRYRERAPRAIVAEMAMLHDRYEISDFYFCSAQFLPASAAAGEKRAAEFQEAVAILGFKPSIFLYLRCDNITPSVIHSLADSGVTTVFVGVESFDDATLLALGKGLTSKQIIGAIEVLQKAGYSSDYRAELRMKLGFMMFTPWTGLDGLERSARYCRQFGIPPKKMLYSLQIHEGTSLPDDLAGTASEECVVFADVAGPVQAVRVGYHEVFAELVFPLERMRALQKAQVIQDPELLAATFQVVDEVNRFAYDAFGELIDAARQGSVRVATARLVAQAQRRRDEFDLPVLEGRIASSTKQLRNACVQSHLERGLDNPQINLRDEAQQLDSAVRYP